MTTNKLFLMCMEVSFKNKPKFGAILIIGVIAYITHLQVIEIRIRDII